MHSARYDRRKKKIFTSWCVVNNAFSENQSRGARENVISDRPSSCIKLSWVVAGDISWKVKGNKIPLARVGVRFRLNPGMSACSADYIQFRRFHMILHGKDIIHKLHIRRGNDIYISYILWRGNDIQVCYQRSFQYILWKRLNLHFPWVFRYQLELK